MQKQRIISTLALLTIICGICSCAKPLAEGKVFTMEPLSKNMPADANSLYYATKWAMDQCGYPAGPEDLAGGVMETKWVPVGAASHYVDTVAGKDYGSNAAYYKMIIKIVPREGGGSKVIAQTKVKAIVNGMKTTGDKEEEMLAKIAEHSRGYNITVTNLGVEE